MSRFTHVRKRLLFWLSWPFLYGYFLSHSRSRVILYTSTGKVLLVQGGWKQLFGDNGYGLPGGGINYGEEPVVGAARELEEELAIEANTGDLEFLGDELVREYGLRYRAYFYRLRVPESVPLQLEVKEIVSAEWFEIAGVSERHLKPEVRQALTLMAQKR